MRVLRQALNVAGLEVAIVKSEFFSKEKFGEANVVVDELTELLPSAQVRTARSA